jgi:hypothetical protein
MIVFLSMMSSKLRREIREPVEPFAEYNDINPLFLLNGIQHRLTTKPKDKYLCVSSLMGVDLKQLAADNSLERRFEIVC